MLTVVKGFNQDIRNESFYDAVILPVSPNFSHLAGITGLMDALHPELSVRHKNDAAIGNPIPPYYYRVVDNIAHARIILSKEGKDIDSNISRIFQMVVDLYNCGHRNILIPCFKSDGMFIEQNFFIDYLCTIFGPRNNTPADLHIYALFNTTYINFIDLPNGIDLKVIAERAPRPRTRNNTPIHPTTMSHNDRERLSLKYDATKEGVAQGGIFYG